MRPACIYQNVFTCHTRYSHWDLVDASIMRLCGYSKVTAEK